MGLVTCPPELAKVACWGQCDHSDYPGWCRHQHGAGGGAFPPNPPMKVGFMTFMMSAFIDEDELARAFGLLATGECDDEGVALFEPIVETDPFVRITGTLKPEPSAATGLYSPWPEYVFTPEGSALVGGSYDVKRKPAKKSEPTRPTKYQKVVVRGSRDIAVIAKPGSQYRSGLKHHKDSERRERGKTVKIRRRKQGKVFDSTLGYPGEGPKPQVGKGKNKREKRDPVCYNCDGKGHRKNECTEPLRRQGVYCHNCAKRGHIDKDCKMPYRGFCDRCGAQGHRGRVCPELRDAPALNARAVQGLPVAQAVRQLDIADGKAVLDDGVGVGPDPVAEFKDDVARVMAGAPVVINQVIEPVVEAKQEVDHEAERQSIIQDMVSKATLMLSNPSKDLTSIDDLSVVQASMAAIARKRELYKHDRDVANTVANYLVNSVRDARMIREAAATRNAREPIQFSVAEYLWRCWYGRRPVSTVDIELDTYGQTALEKLAVLEKQPHASVVNDFGTVVDRWKRYIHWPIKFAQEFCVPVVEEWFKRALVRGLQSRYLGMLPNSLLFQFLTLFEVQHANLILLAITKAVEVFTHAFPSVLLGLYEEGTFNWKRFLLRSAAHMWLTSLPTGVAGAFHLMWNFWVHWKHPTWKLNSSLREPDLTTKTLVQSDVCCAEYPMKATPTQDGFVVKWGEAHCKPHFGLRRFWGVRDVVPTIYRSCSHNERVSMEGRVGKALPAHSSLKVLEQVTRHWKRVCREQLPIFKRLIRPVKKPMPFLDWVHTFPPARRDALIQVWRAGTELRDFKASSFIKREIAMKPVDQVETSFKDPRFIQGCPLELSVEAGPCVRPLAKNVHHGLKPRYYTVDEILTGKQIIYTCGMSGQEVGAAFASCINVITEMCGAAEKVVFLEDDQSRFDLHMMEGPFAFLHRLYSCKLPKKVAKVLRRGVSRGRTQHGTRYSIPYTMQSGWPDTSVGDTLVNACMKYSIHGYGRKWVSIVCGDDSVTITTDLELLRIGGLPSIIEKYAAFGMEVEATVTEEPLDVGFCSGRFFPSGMSYILMPKTGRLLAKLLCDTKDRNVEGRKAWLRGIAATLAHYGQVDPLLAALAIGVSGGVGGGRIIYERENEYKHYLRGSVSVERLDMLVYFDHHYGLSSCVIERLCSQLRCVKLGELSTCPFLNYVACHDL